MTLLLAAAVVLLAGALIGLSLHHRHASLPRPAAAPPPSARRILFPYMAAALSQRALDAALRLARAEAATLVPVFLARVPLTLPLDSPLPRQAAVCLPLQEAIEQRAAAFGVPVDSRVERGRTYRHALRRTIASERFEPIVIAAARDGGGAGEGPPPPRRRGLVAGPRSGGDRDSAPGGGGSAAARPAASAASRCHWAQPRTRARARSRSAVRRGRGRGTILH